MRWLAFLINCAIYGLFYKFMGYEIYEEFKTPTLIYMKKNNYKLINVKESILESQV